MTQDTICCALKRFSLHTDIVTPVARRGGGSPSVSAELNTVETTDTITQLIPIGRHAGEG